MTPTLTHLAPTILAAFLASTVEFVEALTVILAVGVTRGWRGAIAGSATAVIVLALLVAGLGPALAALPVRALQVAVGGLLLLFGLRWLRKACLRAAGVIPLHDEAALFGKETARLEALGGAVAAFDAVGFATTFQITMIEGAEVVFIVVAIGAGGAGLMLPAVEGAGAALAMVAALGLVVHRPLSRIPENTLKLVVGVLLSAFGAFWFGEGAGAAWPGGDLSILGLIGAFAVVAALTARASRRGPARAS